MFTVAANIFKSLVRSKDKTQGRESFATIGFWLEKKLKHQDADQIKQQQIGQLRFWYQRPYELLKTYKEIFGTGIYRFQTNNPTPLILDCGANIGLGVLYFKAIYPDARIVAFEPDANNAAILKKNITENGATDVEIRKEAVWVANTPLQFAAAGSEASKIDTTTGSVTVAGIDFKQILQQYPVIDFLKMDIEGAELTVLEHCADELHRVKNMFLEFHGFTNQPEALTRLFQIIDQHGFTCYIRNAADSIAYPFLHEEKESVFNVQLNLFLTKKNTQ